MLVPLKFAKPVLRSMVNKTASNGSRNNFPQEIEQSMSVPKKWPGRSSNDSFYYSRVMQNEKYTNETSPLPKIQDSPFSPHLGLFSKNATAHQFVRKIPGKGRLDMTLFYERRESSGVFVLMTTMRSRLLEEKVGGKEFLKSVGLKWDDRLGLIIQEIKEVIAKGEDKVVIAYNDVRVPMRSFLEGVVRNIRVVREGTFSIGKYTKPLKTIELKITPK